MNTKQSKIILGIVTVILLGLIGFYVTKDSSQNETLNQINSTQKLNSNVSKENTVGTNTSAPTSNSTSDSQIVSTFKKSTGGFDGSLTLTGYLEIKSVQDFDGKSSDYAFFIITKTNNNLIYDYLREEEGNSFVGNNSIGLGCYQKESNRIFSTNYGDIGVAENVISGNEYQKLITSTQTNLIQLDLTKPIFNGGGGAPTCYSHFRDFEIK